MTRTTTNHQVYYNRNAALSNPCNSNTKYYYDSTLGTEETLILDLPDKIQRPKPVNLTDVNSLTSRFWDIDHILYGFVEYGYGTWMNNCSYPQWMWRTTNWNRQFYGYTGPSMPEPTLEDDIWMKIRKRMEKGQLNLGGYIGEYKETYNMFRSAAKVLNTAWKVAHGRLPKKRRKLTVHDVSAAWLNSQFAVAPVLSDLGDAVNILQSKILDMEGVLPRNFYTKTSGKHYSEFTASNGEGVLSRVKEVKVSVYADYNIQQSIIDFGNPWEWGWEGIPFSFLIDYAIPIGDWLGALNATKGYSNIRAALTTSYWDEYHYTKVNIPENQSNFSQNSTKGYVRKRTWGNRQILTEIPFPSFPKPGFSRSYKRLANSIALLHLMRRQKPTVWFYNQPKPRNWRF